MPRSKESTALSLFFLGELPIEEPSQKDSHSIEAAALGWPWGLQMHHQPRGTWTCHGGGKPGAQCKPSPGGVGLPLRPQVRLVMEV